MEKGLKEKEVELAANIEKIMSLDPKYGEKTCKENNIPLKESEVPGKQEPTLDARD